jgi:hypothetical protein
LLIPHEHSSLSLDFYVLHASLNHTIVLTVLVYKFFISLSTLSGAFLCPSLGPPQAC